MQMKCKNKWTELASKPRPVQIRENIAQGTTFLFDVAILLASTESFFRPLVFVATVRIRNTSLCGVWSWKVLRSFRLGCLPSVNLFVFIQMFYWSVLSPKKTMSRKRSNIVSSPSVKEYHVLYIKKMLVNFYFTVWPPALGTYNRLWCKYHIFKLLVTFSKILHNFAE